jgi:hypothetical protein
VIGNKQGFARCAVLEAVLLSRAGLQIMLEQDIATRVARRNRSNDVVLELLECGRVSVAIWSADEPIADARKIPERRTDR